MACWVISDEARREGAARLAVLGRTRPVLVDAGYIAASHLQVTEAASWRKQETTRTRKGVRAAGVLLASMAFVMSLGVETVWKRGEAV